MGKIKIGDKNGIRFVGNVKGKVFISKRDFNRHFMKIYNAWGIDNSVFEQLKGKVDTWRIDTYQGQRYEIPTLVIQRHIDAGLIIKKNWGHKTQLFIPLKYWTTFNPRQKEFKI